jgi:hypothetical protein
MINEVFNSIHESIKRRYSSDDFMPRLPEEMKSDVIHRGYLRKTQYPIRYDLIPDGKTKNTGKHVYHFKNDNLTGFIEINHQYAPSMSGHETKSHVKFEVEGMKPEEEIDVYRSFVVPSILHHVRSHNPDVVNFENGVLHTEDLIRRMGSSFEANTGSDKITAKRKVDPKFSRIFSHIKKRINIKRGK